MNTLPDRRVIASIESDRLNIVAEFDKLSHDNVRMFLFSQYFVMQLLFSKRPHQSPLKARSNHFTMI